jgi:hypothetical protein
MESKKNKSRTYIVPLLNEYIEIHKSLLIDTYLYDINKSELNLNRINGIYILFKWSDNNVHKLYEQKLLNSELLKIHYDIDVDSYMVYLEFPKEIQSEVDKILEGKYSELTIESKQVILKYWNLGIVSDLYGVLLKTEKRRKKLEEELNVKIKSDAELASIIDVSQEIFDKNNYLIKN